MKILSNFDKAIAENLSTGVKSRLTFKVRPIAIEGCHSTDGVRDTSRRIASATMCGLSLSRMSSSRQRVPTNSRRIKLRSSPAIPRSRASSDILARPYDYCIARRFRGCLGIKAHIMTNYQDSSNPRAKAYRAGWKACLRQRALLRYPVACLGQK